MNRTNVGMVQSRSGLCFTAKAASRLEHPWPLRRAKTSTQQSDRVWCPRLEYYAHPAAAQLLDDAIVQDRLADHGTLVAGAFHLKDGVQASQRVRSSGRGASSSTLAFNQQSRNGVASTEPALVIGIEKRNTSARKPDRSRHAGSRQPRPRASNFRTIYPCSLSFSLDLLSSRNCLMSPAAPSRRFHCS